MSEFNLIRDYFSRARQSEHQPTSPIALGIGDDCAVFSIPENQQLVVSMDTLVEGVHFPAGASAGNIATRAFLTALSDLAAMGAKPYCFTLALTLPAFDENWLASFSQSLHDISSEYGCELIGGDTTKGPLTITVQVHGLVGAGEAIKRSTASSGDAVYVTGTLGDGAAALAMLLKEREFPPDVCEYLEQRFYRPKAQIEEGLLLNGLASAAIDISDGLLADLGHICTGSGVGAEIDLQALPIDRCWRENVSETQAEAWALSGGDDYQLCFTVPPEKQHKVESLIVARQLEAKRIGQIVEGSEVILLRAGTPEKALLKGYDHFV